MFNFLSKILIDEIQKELKTIKDNFNKLKKEEKVKKDIKSKNIDYKSKI